MARGRSARRNARDGGSQLIPSWSFLLDRLDDEVQRLRKALDGGETLEVIDVVGAGVPDGPVPLESIQRAITIHAQMCDVQDAITRHLSDVEFKLRQGTLRDCAPVYFDAHY